MAIVASPQLVLTNSDDRDHDVNTTIAGNTPKANLGYTASVKEFVKNRALDTRILAMPDNSQPKPIFNWTTIISAFVIASVIAVMMLAVFIWGSQYGYNQKEKEQLQNRIESLETKEKVRDNIRRAAKISQELRTKEKK